MNALPATVQTSIGHTFHLTKQIGKGGEGAICQTREQNDIAVKLYWPNKAQSRRDRVRGDGVGPILQNEFLCSVSD